MQLPTGCENDSDEELRSAYWICFSERFKDGVAWKLGRDLYTAIMSAVLHNRASGIGSAGIQHFAVDAVHRLRHQGKLGITRLEDR